MDLLMAVDWVSILDYNIPLALLLALCVFLVTTITYLGKKFFGEDGFITNYFKEQSKLVVVVQTSITAIQDSVQKQTNTLESLLVKIVNDLDKASLNEDRLQAMLQAKLLLVKSEMEPDVQKSDDYKREAIIILNKALEMASQ